MNELLFFFHIVLVAAFTFGTLRFGKEALIGWIALQAILANLFVMKQMVLFGMHVTCGDVFAVGSVMGLNLLQEHFGKDTAKKAMWVCFYFVLFVALVSQLHLFYIPSPYDNAHAAFTTLLSSTPRLLLASLAVFFVVQQFDIRCFAFLKEKISSLTVRNLLTLLLSQLLDTVLFTWIGLYGLVASISHVIFLSFLLKALIIALLSFAVRISTKVAAKP